MSLFQRICKKFKNFLQSIWEINGEIADDEPGKLGQKRKVKIKNGQIIFNDGEEVGINLIALDIEKIEDYEINNLTGETWLFTKPFSNLSKSHVGQFSKIENFKLRFMFGDTFLHKHWQWLLMFLAVFLGSFVAFLNWVLIASEITKILVDNLKNPLINSNVFHSNKKF